MRSLSETRWILAAALALAIVAALPAPARADEWYEGEAFISLANLTPEQARENALNKAREDALSRSQVEIVGMASRHLAETGDSGQVYDGFVQFTQRITRGLILEETILLDAPETVTVGGKPQLQWHLRLRARVEAKVGKSDPGFKVDVTLNRATFRNGEDLVMEFISTKDCYLTVLNLYSNDLLNVVLPNALTPDNFLPAGVRRTYPDAESALVLPVGLMPGKETDQEAILVIATRDRIPFSMKQPAAGDRLLSLNEAMMTINNWLVDIDADKRTQVLSSYRIVR